MATSADDGITVYADDKSAVVLTHDKEFSQRRKHNVIGKHVWLRCEEMDASALLEGHLDEVVHTLMTRTDLWVRISSDGMETSSEWS